MISKELVLFLVSRTILQRKETLDDSYEPRGCAFLKTFYYSDSDLQIIYSKWTVENFEGASKMQLPGCEYNNRLFKDVMVLSKKLGIRSFNGRDAKDIARACEANNSVPFQQISKGIQR